MLIKKMFYKIRSTSILPNLSRFYKIVNITFGVMNFEETKPHINNNEIIKIW